METRGKPSEKGRVRVFRDSQNHSSCPYISCIKVTTLRRCPVDADAQPSRQAGSDISRAQRDTREYAIEDRRIVDHAHTYITLIVAVLAACCITSILSQPKTTVDQYWLILKKAIYSRHRMNRNHSAINKATNSQVRVIATTQ